SHSPRIGSDLLRKERQTTSRRSCCPGLCAIAVPRRRRGQLMRSFTHFRFTTMTMKSTFSNVAILSFAIATAQVLGETPAFAQAAPAPAAKPTTPAPEAKSPAPAAKPPAPAPAPAAPEATATSAAGEAPAAVPLGDEPTAETGSAPE